MTTHQRPNTPGPRRTGGAPCGRRHPQRRRGWIGVWALAALGLALPGCRGPSGSPPPDTAHVASSAPRARELSLVAIGDSIPYNSQDDCESCVGFVARYATAAAIATGRPVTVTNVSQHNGLTLPQLLAELDDFRTLLSAADIIIVGIAHNSNELSADRPCGAPVTANLMPDWSRMTRHCAIAAARRYRPQYDRLYTQIKSWRAGKPTILRTIDRYDDYTGYPKISLTATDSLKIKTFLDTWNTMLCASATAHGFTCADIYRAFNGPDGRQPSGDLLAHDYTHPSNKGNARIAETLTAQGFAPLGRERR